MFIQEYINGSNDALFDLDPAKLELSSQEFFQDATLVAMKAGCLATVNAAGHVVLCDGATVRPLGVIVNDVTGYIFENVPALASGKVPLMQGGGLIRTDNVVEENLVPGTDMYCSPDGIFTSVDAGNGVVVGTTRTANSTADKTVRIQLFI